MGHRRCAAVRTEIVRALLALRLASPQLRSTCALNLLAAVQGWPCATITAVATYEGYGHGTVRRKTETREQRTQTRLLKLACHAVSAFCAPRGVCTQTDLRRLSGVIATLILLLHTWRCLRLRSLALSPSWRCNCCTTCFLQCCFPGLGRARLYAHFGHRCHFAGCP
jgi:hypothetical protein